jgi:hypothetical protein
MFDTNAWNMSRELVRVRTRRSFLAEGESS